MAFADQVPQGAVNKRLRLSGSPNQHGPQAVAIVSSLTKAIEADVIPRLVLAHRAIPAIVPVEIGVTPAEEVARFAEMVLSQDVAAATAAVQSLRQQGKPLDAIYVDLLAPAAAHLRDLWTRDLCDFADVTLGLWRLQQVLREFSTEFRQEGEQPETGMRALLVPAPGEKNNLSYVMFGLVMVSEFFRRDGWDAWIEPDSTANEFSSTIRSQWFDVVELLVSGEKKMDALAERIRTIRRESPNRELGVMVCGPAFVEHPELVLLVGADVMATDPRQGALQAKKAVGLLAKRD